jgi:hypothetical protein
VLMRSGAHATCGLPWEMEKNISGALISALSLFERVYRKGLPIQPPCFVWVHVSSSS